MELKDFRKTLLLVAAQSVKAGTMQRSDLILLRFASLHPKLLKTIYDASFEQALDDGYLPTEIDWEAILKILMSYIIEIIKLFLGMA